MWVDIVDAYFHLGEQRASTGPALTVCRMGLVAEPQPSLLDSLLETCVIMTTFYHGYIAVEKAKRGE